ncbi:Ig-like domain-containing protein [Clostridium sp. L74]|uniref:Ig-like domain-containing protein n=1 Tax=Clostridium sp. L74 TaxID=1560217 RepID=UPI0006C2C774|nr:Ig-like domain-containing protein [Clostridium sp. L74]KOR26970.1 hypothetical protein ND00_01490 [Clostridium sp. L74]
MRKKAMISLTLLLIVMLSVSGCKNKNKTSVLGSNIKKEAAMKEDEVKKFIADGSKLLNEGKYDDAKSSFEKAISMDKSNKRVYIEIKNKYMEKKRIDDAYYFVKLTISNNVDTENMKKLLNDMKSKFEVTKLNDSVYQNHEYKLPDKIKAKINNEDKEVKVVWSNTNVDTSRAGIIKYEGKIEQYDRFAELNLNIIKTQEDSNSKNKNTNKVDYKSDKNTLVKKVENTNKVNSKQDKVSESSKENINNSKFNQVQAVQYARNYYDNNEDITYSVIPEYKNENGKGYYEIIAKSKSFIKQGGTGTVGVLKVFEDGSVIKKS